MWVQGDLREFWCGNQLYEVAEPTYTFLRFFAPPPDFSHFTVVLPRSGVHDVIFQIKEIFVVMENNYVRTQAEEREARFWDNAALIQTDLHVDAATLSAADKRRLALFGSLAGKRVLDVGCGTGKWAVLLAQQGAQVWAIDISPESVAMTVRRAQQNQQADSIHASVMSAHDLQFEDGFFDAVHGQDIIHHLDATIFGAEIARVLSAKGCAVFSENSANNPLLMFARNHVCGHFGIPRWSSDDEYPLTRAKLAEFGSHFAGVQVEYPEFRFMHYLNAKLDYRNRAINWLCSRVDQGVYRWLPGLRQYSYRQLICCKRSATSADAE